MNFELTPSGQILLVENIGDGVIIKTHFGMEYEYSYDNDGNIIETRKFNFDTGEYEIVAD